MSLDLKESEFFKQKRAGVLLPLFSMRSAGDWGCGDMGSLKEWIEYLSGYGVSILQILPIHETEPGQNCPYSALSAYVIDPIYISINDVSDVAASQQAQDLIKQYGEEIKFWRSEKKVFYRFIKSAKYKVLWAAYEHFWNNEKSANTARYEQFLEFHQKHASWLVPYCIFRSAKDNLGWTSWKHWEKRLKELDLNYLREYSVSNYKQMMFFSYLQWQLQLQLAEVRRIAASRGVLLFGDIPFGVNLDSADVWSNQSKYLDGYEIGAPKDQFSEGGQKWGLPAYNWPAIEQSDFNLWRGKIARACEIYDMFRLDHFVGFFRTWIFGPGDDIGKFDLEGEDKQKARGAAFMEAVCQSAGGKLPIGEDLGVIPDYVRAYMKEVSLPGYKVIRWEKDNEVFREPREYPLASLATTATHDTETLREWWDIMPDWQRANVWEMISAQKTDGRVPFTAEVHRAIFKRVMGAGSCFVIFPLQDIIGEKERINTPGTVGEENWSYRVPFETAEFNSAYLDNMRMFKEEAQASGRI